MKIHGFPISTNCQLDNFPHCMTQQIHLRKNTLMTLRNVGFWCNFLPSANDVFWFPYEIFALNDSERWWIIVGSLMTLWEAQLQILHSIIMLTVSIMIFPLIIELFTMLAHAWWKLEVCETEKVKHGDQFCKKIQSEI